MIKVHKESHTDHSIPAEVRSYVLEKFARRKSFFVETIEYPDRATLFTGKSLNDWSSTPHSYESKLPPVPCALHLNVPEDEVYYAKRGDREYESRMCKRPPRMVREVTIIAGPHPDDPDAGMILYTMYGGLAAPKEPNDPRLTDEEREESIAFWSKAALGSEE